MPYLSNRRRKFIEASTIHGEWEFGKGVTYPPELAGREVDWSKIE